MGHVKLHDGACGSPCEVYDRACAWRDYVKYMYISDGVNLIHKYFNQRRSHTQSSLIISNTQNDIKWELRKKLNK